MSHDQHDQEENVSSHPLEFRPRTLVQFLLRNCYISEIQPICDHQVRIVIQ
jgi:hypothetical protein